MGYILRSKKDNHICLDYDLGLFNKINLVQVSTVFSTTFE